jgi:predicted DNA-binding protein
MEKPVQVNFRMPVELKDKLEAAAKQSGRSTTGEIVARLEESLAAPSSEAVVKALARLEFLLVAAQRTLRMKTLEASLLATPASAGLPLLKGRVSDDTLAVLQLAIDSATEDREKLSKEEEVLSDQDLEAQYVASEAKLKKLLLDEAPKPHNS